MGMVLFQTAFDFQFKFTPSETSPVIIEKQGGKINNRKVVLERGAPQPGAIGVGRRRTDPPQTKNHPGAAWQNR